MTFWGVIVKPGEPYTHKVNKERSRLRVVLATLGDEVSGAEGRTVLKCKVGDSEPISLCNLLCGNSETMNLNIEFDEETDVLFTVIGSCSVHISGNYLKSSGGTSSDTNSDDTTSSNSDDTTSSRSATMGKVVRHVTMNVKDAPKIDLMSDDSKSLSTDSPKAPKKPKFKKRKRAKLH